MLGDLRLDKCDLVLGQRVSLVELRICPLLVQRQVWDESVDMLRGVLSGLTERYKEAGESRTQVTRVVHRLRLIVEDARDDVALGTSGAGLSDDRLAEKLGLDCRARALD